MNQEQRRIIREELWRSVGWAALGIVGWPTLASETTLVETTLFTVFGLPVVTWGVLTAGMVAVRTVTGAELQRQPQMPGFLLEGTLLSGTVGVYLVAVVGYSALLVAAGLVAVGAGTGLWYWYAGVFDSAAESTA